jgi:hypothetical protein
MMARFSGLTQANVRRVLYRSDATHASSSGLHTSVRKKKAKPKPLIRGFFAIYTQQLFLHSYQLNFNSILYSQSDLLNADFSKYPLAKVIESEKFYFGSGE